MQVTFHACKRYAERIIGMAEAEAIKYAEESEKELSQEILKLYEKAKWIYTGYIADFPKSSYYVYDSEIILITRPPDKIITLYPITLPYSPGANQRVIKALIREIEQQHKEMSAIVDVAKSKKKAQKEQLELVSKRVERTRAILASQEKRQREIQERLAKLEDRPIKLRDEIKQNVQQLVMKCEEV